MDDFLAQIDQQGRRLESIIRQCDTKATKNQDNDKLYFAYLNRMFKATKQKVRLVKILQKYQQAIEDSKNS